MTRRFTACISIVLAHEGGYADHSADPGGATNMGITRKTLAAWRGVEPWTDLPKSAVRDLRREEAEAIYRVRYWNACRAEEMGPGLDLALFDFAVNSGPARAVRMLQAELQVSTDGIIGPVTLAALNVARGERGLNGLIEALCERRRAFVRGLVHYDSFGRGWERRITAVEEAALDAARAEQSQADRKGSFNMLSGYRTYIVAAAMLIAGVAQVMGIDLPALEAQSAGQLIFEAIAVIFLRKGMKSAPSTV